MGILFVILGCLAIVAGIFGKEFYAADVITGTGYKQKRSRWSGRLIFIAGGLFFIAAGIKFLVWGQSNLP